MYVTLRPVRATDGAVEKQGLPHTKWLCVCSLRYPTWIGHAPNFHPQPARLYNIFPHYLVKGMILGGGKKKLLNIKWVLISHTTCVWNISHSKKKLSEIWSKIYIGLHVNHPLFLSDFNETWIFSTDLKKKYSNIKFNENPSSESRTVPCGHTDGQTWRSK